MGWSLEAQLEKTLAENDRLVRQRIHDVIVAGGGDPASAVGLYTIDNYRPEWTGSDERKGVFSAEAILQWSHANFPLEA